MKTLAIIGSTGSIGNSALNVFKKNKDKFKLIYLAANTNYKKLIAQKKKYNPKKIFLIQNNINKDKIDNLNYIIKNNKKKIDYIISGVSGYDSLSVNLKLIKISKNLLLANKETIICGGDFFLNFAKKNNCNLIPIDSEHYCINFFLKNFRDLNKIENIYLVASGGPFIDKKFKYNEKITSVIKHPNWKMGKEISVNSSNFANKVLELFEAKILFKLPCNKIDIIVEKQSNAHSIVKLKNKLYLPILHKPNMEVAISNSLNLHHNHDLKFKDIKIRLKSPDVKRFPLIKIGKKILKQYGHIGMIYFTVLNSKLVNMFLEKKINYGDIVAKLIKIFNNKKITSQFNKKIHCIEDVIAIINHVKKLKI